MSYGFQLSPWKDREGGGSNFGDIRETVARSLIQRLLANVIRMLTHPMGIMWAESGTISNMYLENEEERNLKSPQKATILNHYKGEGSVLTHDTAGLGTATNCHAQLTIHKFVN